MSGKDSKDRKFYDLDKIEEPETRASNETDKTELAKLISDNVIGKHSTFLSPFGRKNVVYCDYTASGAFSCPEDTCRVFNYDRQLQ